MGDHPINLRDWQAKACVEERLSVLAAPITPQPSDYKGASCPPPSLRDKKRAAPYFDAYNHGPFGCWWDEYDRQGPDWIRLPLIVGERYWVREAWCLSAPGGYDAKPGYDPETGANSIWYRATDSGQCEGPWRSSTQLPRWASRITIVPTEVRVCRLHDLTNDDCIAAGVPLHPNRHAPRVGPIVDDFARQHGLISHYGAQFRERWTDQHGPGAYERNPWVSVARCAVHLRNIDTMESERG